MGSGIPRNGRGLGLNTLNVQLSTNYPCPTDGNYRLLLEGNEAGATGNRKLGLEAELRVVYTLHPV